MEKTASARGRFFRIAPENWAIACELGMNEAVAYLVLAQGTAGNHKTTSWSAEALHKYTGITWERGKAAIERLIRSGLLRYGEKHQRSKPRYEFVSAAEAARERHRARIVALCEEDRRVLELLGTERRRASKSMMPSVNRLVAAGLAWQEDRSVYLPVTPPQEEPAQPDFIWLPNTLLTGTPKGETPPVQRLKQSGDIWALRLLVDLYREHNLRDDGGISPALLRQEFERREVGRRGPYTIWAFKPNDLLLWWKGALQVHHARKASDPQQNHPIWASLAMLVETGLLSYVPHLWDNDPEKGQIAAAEILLPYGISGSGGEAVEMAIGRAAHQAALRAAYPEKARAAAQEGFVHLCPVRSTIPHVCMVGVARLRYRPHTTRTGTWITRLKESGADLLRELEELFRERAD